MDFYFVNTTGSFFSDNYQIVDAFGNPMCAKISRIDYVQKYKPRSSGYDPGWLIQYYFLINYCTFVNICSI